MIIMQLMCTCHFCSSVCGCNSVDCVCVVNVIETSSVMNDVRPHEGIESIDILIIVFNMHTLWASRL